MAVTQTVFRTISCNNIPACDKSVTFEQSKEKDVLNLPENQWVKSFRTIQTIDNRILGYCSDLCEIEGAKTGVHNLPEQKRIIADAGNPAQVKMAAEAAAAAKAATEQLKAGNPVQGLVQA